MADAATKWARRAFALDARSLGVMRLCLGAILTIDLGARVTDARALYSDDGILPRALARRMVPAAFWSALNAAGSSAFAVAVFLAAIVAAVAFCVGYRTRLANLVSWVLLVSIQNRNPLVYHSGDAVMRLVLFWCLFLPVGERISVDGRRSEKPTPLVASVGSFCLVLQIIVLFAFLADHKLMGHAWRAGTAVEDALRVEQYQRPLGRWLLEYPALLVVLTYITLAVQVITAVLLLLPGRLWPRVMAMALTIATQLGFGLSFRLGHFPWTMSAAMFAFIPTDVWDWLAARWHRIADLEPGHGLRANASGLSSAAAAVACVLGLLWNLGESGATVRWGDRDVAIPDSSIGHLAQALRLDQRWSMFSPNPQTEDGWLVMAAQTVEGERLDLLPWLLGHPALLGKDAFVPPARMSDAFGFERSHRWAMALLDLAGNPRAPALEGLAGYGCREWNTMASPSKRVQKVDLLYVRFEHLPGGATSPATTRHLWHQECS